MVVVVIILYHYISQSIIEFTVILHNAVARKRYLTLQSATFTEDVDGFQKDWQLICTSNVFMMLTALTMSLSISKLCFNEHRYHLQLYWSHSISTLLLMPGDASIIVHMIENWNAFIIIHVLLDFLRCTTKAAPSMRPLKHIIHVDMLIPLFHIPW